MRLKLVQYVMNRRVKDQEAKGLCSALKRVATKKPPAPAVAELSDEIKQLLEAFNKLKAMTADKRTSSAPCASRHKTREKVLTLEGRLRADTFARSTHVCFLRLWLNLKEQIDEIESLFHKCVNENTGKSFGWTLPADTLKALVRARLEAGFRSDERDDDTSCCQLQKTNRKQAFQQRYRADMLL
jgi:hypothetical protein